jgi:Domain of unknown function (DUF4388)
LAFEGMLDAFALPDVLRLLAVTRKTGCLLLEGDGGRGCVWVYDGALVAATTEGAVEAMPVDEVMFQLLRVERGSFRFTADEPSLGDDRQLLEIESILQRASQLLEEWRDLELVVPSLTHRVALAQELSRAQVTLDARVWPALVAMASSRSVGELAGTLGLGELGISRLVGDLVDLGVAVVGPPGTEPTGSSDGRRTTGELTAAR